MIDDKVDAVVVTVIAGALAILIFMLGINVSLGASKDRTNFCLSLCKADQVKCFEYVNK